MKRSERDRHFQTIERFLIEGREGGVSLQMALESVMALRSFVGGIGVSKRWYKHRIVKSKAVPGVRLLSDPLAMEAERELREEIGREIDVYFRSHKPCLRLVDSFCIYRDGGLVVMAVGTLYGPGSIRDEVLMDKIGKGEMV